MEVFAETRLATDGTALLKRVVIGTLAIVIVVNTHQVFGIGTKCPAEFYEFFLGPISITLGWCDYSFVDICIYPLPVTARLFAHQNGSVNRAFES